MGYTNSPLAGYTRISPHKTANRRHAIDTITIHCVVGQWTAKQGCDFFATTDRECSANYVVGKDGSIGLSVEEKDRAWTSGGSDKNGNPIRVNGISGSDNDHRAVTIEVASDTTHPYAVTDAAYAALIELCADICRRNEIKRLLWKGDKSLVGKTDQQNMTVHRWFANKSCPGDYLYDRHGDIAAKANAKLGASTAPATPTPTAPAAAAKDVGEMTDAEMFAFFRSQGLTDAGASGLMGNLYAESGLAANNLQNTGNKKLGMTDAEYTAAVDNGTYANFIRDSQGYGLAQWTYWSRKQAMLEFMKSAGVSIGHKRKQCEFLMKELAGYKAVLQTLKTTGSVKEASDAVLTGFEKPADQSDAVKAKRAGFSQGYYDKYASGKAAAAPSAPAAPSATPAAGSSVPYTVKVTADVLNVRSGPGTSYKVNMAIKDQGTYTIVEEKDGWGRLKSGAGWISLAYTKKR